MSLRTEELDRIVTDVRERFGSRLPPRPLPGEVERAEQRRMREEQTIYVLSEEVMPELNRERLDTGVRVLTDDDVDTVIQRILDGIFAIEKLADAMREHDVENVMVKGSGPVRVEYAAGRTEYRPAIAATDADLLAIIRDQALAADRPFSYRVPYVDLQLPDGSRFHAEGFDIVDSPIITIRRPRLVEVDLPELVGYGSIDPTLADFLTRSVEAGFVIVVSGLMNSGKTTMLRGLCLSGFRPDEHMSISPGQGSERGPSKPYWSQIGHGPKSRASARRAASWSSPGRTCAYTSSVMPTPAWPRRCERTFTGTPAARAAVA